MSNFFIATKHHFNSIPSITLCNNLTKYKHFYKSLLQARLFRLIQVWKGHSVVEMPSEDEYLLQSHESLWLVHMEPWRSLTMKIRRYIPTVGVKAEAFLIHSYLTGFNNNITPSLGRNKPVIVSRTSSS